MRQMTTGLWPHSDLSVLALLLFFGFFIAMLFWVFSKSRQSYFEEISKLPLEDGGEKP